MHRRQIVRHAGILRAMMDTGAPIERVGDSFVRLAEHPDFLRCSRPHHEPTLEARLWRSAADRGLVHVRRADGPIPLMLHGASGIVHGTLPGTGLLPVIVCWFGESGLFIAADLDRGHEYHRLYARRPAPAPAPRPRWRPFRRGLAVSASAGR